jgi:hypothetical protein
MSNKFNTIALGTVLGLSAVAFSGVSASVAAMRPLSPVVASDTNAGRDGIVQIKHKKKHGKKHFNYCNDWNGGCYSKYRHKHRRGYDNGVYLSLPLIFGGGYGAYNYYDDYYGGYDDYGYDGVLSSRHVRYCLNKYKSYKPRSNTWVSYSGKVKKCYSPYM